MKQPIPPSQRSALTGAVLFFASVAGALAQQPAVALDGRSYVNHGLVGVGRMPHDLRDKFGETFGSFSAFMFEPGTWQRNADGSYSGTLVAQPDRGYNVVGTTNYVPRFNKIDVVLRPDADGAAQQNQVTLTLADTIQYEEAEGTPLTALDPTPAGTGTRPGFPALPQGFNGRICLDAEGIVPGREGSFWVSDEYGPYLYQFAADGTLLAAIRPPEALIPKRNGADSFSSDSAAAGQPPPSPGNPTTGRQNNQGLEGLALSRDGNTLFALLQSAARQDGGTGGSSATRFNTRLLAYDIAGATPTLVGEYVLQLPTFLQGSSTRVAAQSELLAINATQFLVIARDSGNGRGLATAASVYRRVLLYDIGGATNIAGTAYDDIATPIAPGGVLAAGIIPAQSTTLVDINDATELAKFGLHNGPADDANNLSEKWEALALVPALDPAAPEDWFLFVGNDNDFLTTNGFQVGAAYNGGTDNDSMVLVYRLTLPTRLLNVSSRARVGVGDDANIVGFIVGGTHPKTLLVRGVGPALAGFGVSGALADPTITVFDEAGRAIAGNDDWSDDAAVAAAAQSVAAFPLGAGSADAALLLDLDPGAYTVHVTPKGGATGIVLAEVYELP